MFSGLRNRKGSPTAGMADKLALTEADILRATEAENVKVTIDAAIYVSEPYQQTATVGVAPKAVASDDDLSDWIDWSEVDDLYPKSVVPAISASVSSGSQFEGFDDWTAEWPSVSVSSPATVIGVKNEAVEIALPAILAPVLPVESAIDASRREEELQAVAKQLANEAIFASKQRLRQEKDQALQAEQKQIPVPPRPFVRTRLIDVRPPVPYSSIPAIGFFQKPRDGVVDASVSAEFKRQQQAQVSSIKMGAQAAIQQSRVTHNSELLSEGSSRPVSSTGFFQSCFVGGISSFFSSLLSDDEDQDLSQNSTNNQGIANTAEDVVTLAMYTYGN
jgi:hypothetical protein